MSNLLKIIKNFRFWLFIFIIFLIIFLFGPALFHQNKINLVLKSPEEIFKDILAPHITPLDKEDYDVRIKNLANVSSTSKSTLWPVKTLYPLDGAILPFKRVIAYYGNFYSTGMGILGQYSESEVFRRLNIELQKWNKADPETPTIPAIHYIVVTAQGSKGEDGKYRARMPDSQIEKAITMAHKINAIVFLDIQVGLSNLPSEIPLLSKYLKMPEVHLGIDPEFSMKTGARPGTVVGTYDATDINYAIDYLAKIVKDNNLPPKILIVHRYTQKMLTNYQLIKTVPEVQVVINMDGWGIPERKINTYKTFIYPEPVEFTGFKLFYKNDTLEPGVSLMSPEDVLELTPRPIYIQYQ